MKAAAPYIDCDMFIIGSVGVACYRPLLDGSRSSYIHRENIYLRTQSNITYALWSEKRSYDFISPNLDVVKNELDRRLISLGYELVSQERFEKLRLLI